MSERDIINTMIGEAGGHEGGLTAVGYTILNRSVRDGQTPDQVVKAPGQYAGYSNPGSAAVKAQNDPAVRAKAERIWQAVQSRSVPDPTGGGFNFRAASAARGMAAPHGTVNIGGNVFARGSGSPQTALSAINDVAPVPQQRPAPAEAYAAPSPVTPSVRAISVNPNGTPVQPQMILPQAAMYGINRLTPGQVTHAPSDFTTQDSGSPIDERLSALLAPAQFQQPQPSAPLISRPVQTVPINSQTGNPFTGQELAQVAANREAARLRGDTGSGQVASAPAVRIPQPSTPLSSTMRSVPPPTDFTLFGTPSRNDFEQRADASFAAHPVQPPSPFSGVVGNAAFATPAQRNANDIVADVPPPHLASPSTIDATSPLDYSRLGLSFPTGNTASAAINSATTPTAPTPSYAPPTTTYTTKQMQVSNPAYLKYIAAQGADRVGAGPGSFASLGLLNTPTVAPPRFITQTVRVPTVSRPSGGILSIVPPTKGAPAPTVLSAPAPAVGFNGRTSVTSNELAGANQGFGGQNAVMPDSMNNSRWLTGY